MTEVESIRPQRRKHGQTDGRMENASKEKSSQASRQAGRGSRRLKLTAPVFVRCMLVSDGCRRKYVLFFCAPFGFNSNHRLATDRSSMISLSPIWLSSRNLPAIIGIDGYLEAASICGADWYQDSVEYLQRIAHKHVYMWAIEVVPDCHRFAGRASATGRSVLPK